MGCRLSSSLLKGKSPLAMELIAERYRKAEARLGPAARVRRSFQEDSLERNSLHAPIIWAPVLRAVIEIIVLPTNFTAIKEDPLRVSGKTRDSWHFSGDGVRFLRAGERPRVWRAKSLTSRLQADALCRSLTDGAAVAEHRLLGR
jgi:hypothetical protein